MSERNAIPPIKHIWLLLVHLAVYGGFAILLGAWLGWPELVYASLLIWVSQTDFVSFEVPDSAVIGLVLSGLGLHWWLDGTVIWYLSAAVLWSVGFWGLSLLARYALGEDGLGLGDVKLMGGIAAWLGFEVPLYVVLCASIAGIGAIIVTQLKQGNELSRKVVAFGPFLCLSAWVFWLIGIAV